MDTSSLGRNAPMVAIPEACPAFYTGSSSRSSLESTPSPSFPLSSSAENLQGIKATITGRGVSFLKLQFDQISFHKRLNRALNNYKSTFFSLYARDQYANDKQAILSILQRIKS